MVDVIAGHPATAPLRVAVVAAHPDDEIVSAGAMLRRLQASGAVVHVIHVTDGAPRNTAAAREHNCASIDEYRDLRRRELRQALTQVGISPWQCTTIGVADQEAAHELVRVARAIGDCLTMAGVDVVLSHPFEGGHPDHDAAAFAVHAAAAAIPGRLRPTVVEFTSYHCGREGIQTGVFLRDTAAQEEAVLELSAEEQDVKMRARHCFVSQAPTLEQFPTTFERFRPAPRYEFAARPHDGRLFYEHFEWKLDGGGWESAARKAMCSLGFRSDEWL